LIPTFDVISLGVTINPFNIHKGASEEEILHKVIYVSVPPAAAKTIESIKCNSLSWYTRYHGYGWS
jgi:hypothetical protein